MKLSIMVYTVYVVGMLCSACSHSYRDKKGIDGTMGLSNGTLSNGTINTSVPEGSAVDVDYDQICMGIGLFLGAIIQPYYNIIWNKIKYRYHRFSLNRVRNCLSRKNNVSERQEAGQELNDMNSSPI